MEKTLFGFDTDSRWDYENGFYLTSHPTRIAKALAHYELYNRIRHLPGSIVECGVYKGASLIRFATFRELYESAYARKIIGFDAFGKFPGQSDPRDKKFIKGFEKAGGDGIPVADLKEVLAYKNFENIELVPGDIVKTVPQYVSEHPELKVALLHVDVDVYRPSVVILEHLFSHVVKGGLVVFDDYGTIAGETAAVDEFLAKENLPIEKLMIANTPAFVRKA